MSLGLLFAAACASLTTIQIPHTHVRLGGGRDYDGMLIGAPAVSLGFASFVRGDFDAFARRGGRIIVYQGADDREVPAELVTRFTPGARPQGALRLYVIPHAGHCVDDDVRNRLFTALERWIESSVTPAASGSSP